ncbi:unnamed protein product [Protopolystoma xenopodis]|uniref:Uncharacterized protein n=1 Tax=Protopolystoma xenopodis TaxID=117903 RepID=A0A448X2X6_9PLAT|nr:unnamed protein product [Protopolystoma xenopodis]
MWRFEAEHLSDMLLPMTLGICASCQNDGAHCTSQSGQSGETGPLLGSPSSSACGSGSGSALGGSGSINDARDVNVAPLKRGHMRRSKVTAGLKLTPLQEKGMRW